MSKRTRYFVLASVTILGVGLTTGLVTSYVGLPGTVFSRAAGPDELQYIPPGAALVAHAKVREVVTSDFRERFRKFEPDTTERDEFEQKTGVNIEQDIETVTAALLPRAEGATTWSPEGGVLVLARGRFDQSRLEALAIEHGGKVEDYQGKRLITHSNDPSDTHDFGLGFLDADLLAIGSYNAIKQSIDARGGNNIVSNNELMAQIQELESNNVWAVGHFDAIAREVPTEFRDHVPAIQWFSAAGHVNGGLTGVFKAETKDDESGQNLREIVRGFMALAKMQAGSKPEIKTLVDSFQLGGEGKNVSIAFTIPSELFHALAAMGAKPGIH
jgi:hypothetical protein